MPSGKREAAARFLLDTVRRDAPARWAEVRKAATDAGHRSTVIYEALKGLRRSGDLVLEDGYLWNPEPSARNGWQAITKLMDLWEFVRENAIPPEQRVPFARSLGSTVSRVTGLPLSPGLVRRLGRDLPSLPRAVFVATLPMLSRLVRLANVQVIVTSGVQNMGVWTPEALENLKTSMWPSFVKLLSMGQMTMEEINLCAGLLVEFSEANQLSQAQVELSVRWAAERLVAASSQTEYLDRWEALRGFLSEGFRHSGTLKHQLIRSIHLRPELVQAKPWLSDLSEQILTVKMAEASPKRQESERGGARKQRLQ